MKLFRKKHREIFKVQLHVASKEGIKYSHREIWVTTLDEARLVAMSLRRDNRWGNENEWPHVTIHNNLGEWFPEEQECLVENSDGELVPWEGR